jgi:hypothetical protein
MTATAGGAPVIPRHSPGPTTSSPVQIPGPPQGIHIFNPGTIEAFLAESKAIQAKPELPSDDRTYCNEESIGHSHVLEEQLSSPKNDHDEVDAIRTGQEEHESLLLDRSTETSAVTVDETSVPLDQTRQIMPLPQDPEKCPSIIPGQDGTDALEYQETPQQSRVVAQSLYPESFETPLSSATSMVVHSESFSDSTSGVNQAASTSTDLVLLNQQETQLAFYTPRSNSRFAFVIDEETVPSELKKLGEATMRRRHLFQTRIHELECQLASLTAKLAHESMDREASLSDILPAHVYQPLEVVAERLLVEQDMARRPQLVAPTTSDELESSLFNENVDTKDSDGVAQPSLTKLERRLSKLDCQMTTHVHRTMFDAKREKLEAVQDQLLHEITPELHMEATKADKREGSMNRRWESLAGILARRYIEESSSRKASLALVEEQLRAALHQQETEDIIVLSKLQELRAKLEQERAERLTEDERLKDLIAERGVSLQRFLLETLGDPLD